MLSDSLATAAEMTILRGEFEQALELALEGDRISQSIHNSWGEAYNKFSVGMGYLERGNFDESLRAMHASVEKSDQAQFLAGSLTMRLLLAWVYLTLGDATSAFEMGEQISRVGQTESEISKEHKFWQAFSTAHTYWQAYYAFYKGDLEGASALLEEIGELTSVQESEFYYAPMISLLYIEVALAKRDYEQALELVHNLEVKMRANQFGLLYPDVLQNKARALLGLGRANEAYQALLRARAVARKQGSRRSLYSILVDLLRLSSALGEPLPALEGSKEEAEEAHSPAAFLAEAREALEYILAHISDPERRAAFLSRPGLREIIES
jgi:ATP/maltotriose-dependent transcriptional regulator MalT